MNDKIAGKFKDSLTPYDKAELKDADEKLEKMFDIAQKERHTTKQNLKMLMRN